LDSKAIKTITTENLTMPAPPRLYSLFNDKNFGNLPAQDKIKLMDVWADETWRYANENKLDEGVSRDEIRRMAGEELTKFNFPFESARRESMRSVSDPSISATLPSFSNVVGQDIMAERDRIMEKHQIQQSPQQQNVPVLQPQTFDDKIEAEEFSRSRAQKFALDEQLESLHGRVKADQMLANPDNWNFQTGERKTEVQRPWKDVAVDSVIRNPIYGKLLNLATRSEAAHKAYNIRKELEKLDRNSPEFNKKFEEYHTWKSALDSGTFDLADQLFDQAQAGDGEVFRQSMAQNVLGGMTTLALDLGTLKMAGLGAGAAGATKGASALTAGHQTGKLFFQMGAVNNSLNLATKIQSGEQLTANDIASAGGDALKSYAQGMFLGASGAKLNSAFAQQNRILNALIKAENRGKPIGLHLQKMSKFTDSFRKMHMDNPLVAEATKIGVRAGAFSEAGALLDGRLIPNLEEFAQAVLFTGSLRAKEVLLSKVFPPAIKKQFERNLKESAEKHVESLRGELGKYSSQTPQYGRVSAEINKWEDAIKSGNVKKMFWTMDDEKAINQLLRKSPDYRNNLMRRALSGGKAFFSKSEARDLEVLLKAAQKDLSTKHRQEFWQSYFRDKSKSATEETVETTAAVDRGNLLPMDGQQVTTRVDNEPAVVTKTPQGTLEVTKADGKTTIASPARAEQIIAKMPKADRVELGLDGIESELSPAAQVQAKVTDALDPDANAAKVAAIVEQQSTAPVVVDAPAPAPVDTAIDTAVDAADPAAPTEYDLQEIERYSNMSGVPASEMTVEDIAWMDDVDSFFLDDEPGGMTGRGIREVFSLAKEMGVPPSSVVDRYLSGELDSGMAAADTVADAIPEAVAPDPVAAPVEQVAVPEPAPIAAIEPPVAVDAPTAVETAVDTAPAPIADEAALAAKPTEEKRVVSQAERKQVEAMADEFAAKMKKMSKREKQLLVESTPNVAELVVDLAERGKLTKLVADNVSLGSDIADIELSIDRIKAPAIKPKSAFDSLKAHVNLDDSRKVIHSVYHDAKNNLLVATNGKALVTHPQKIDGDSYILGVDGKERIEGDYPKYQNVFPDIKGVKPLRLDITNLLKKAQVAASLGGKATVRLKSSDIELFFDPSLMLNSVKSLIELGNKKVDLYYGGGVAPIVLTGDKGTQAVIMPGREWSSRKLMSTIEIPWATEKPYMDKKVATAQANIGKTWKAGELYGGKREITGVTDDGEYVVVDGRGDERTMSQTILDMYIRDDEKDFKRELEQKKKSEPAKPKETTDAKPDTTSARGKAAEEAFSAIAQVLKDGTGAKVQRVAKPLPNDDPAHGLSAGLIDALEDSLGVKLELFVDTADGENVPTGVFYSKGREFVFVNTGADKPGFQIAGHEFVHWLRANHPEIYKEMDAVLNPLLKDLSKHGEQVNKAREAVGVDKLGADDIAEEVYGDLMGQTWGTSETWEALAKDNPTLFNKIATLAREFLRKIIDALRGKGYQGSRMFKDVKAAEKAVRDAMVKVAKVKAGVVDVPVAKPTAKDSVMFSVPSSNLIVAHNVTADNVRHIAKMGGMAMPSLAVARADVSSFDNFGEISILANKALIDPRQDSAAKTFDADIYSPRHPSTLLYDIDKEKWNSIMENRNVPLGLTFPSQDDIERDGLKAFAYNEAARLEYLKSIGRDPKILPKEKPSIKITPGLKQFIGKPLWKIEEDPNFAQEAKRYYQKQEAEAAKATGDSRKLFFDDSGELNSNLSRDFARRLSAYKPGKIDKYELRKMIEKRFNSPKIKDGYNQWVQDTFGGLVAQEKLFDGFTHSGSRRYLPYTLANVIKQMKKHPIRGGEGGTFGAGKRRALIAKQFRSIAEMQKDRDRIVSTEDMERIKKDVDNEFSELMNYALKHRAHTGYNAYDNFADDLDAMAVGDMKHLREMYPGREPFGKMKEFLSKLKSLPTEYFETKMTRQVGLNEFAGAVVPSTAPKDILEILENAGLKIIKYKANDSIDRKVKRNNLAEKLDIKFSFPDTTEATATDKAYLTGEGSDRSKLGAKGVRADAKLRKSDDIKFTFAGAKATTANLPSLNKAKSEKDKGVSRGQIWKSSGWWEIVPGQWSFELNDRAAKLRPEFKDGLWDRLNLAVVQRNYPPTLEQVLDYPALFEAYPGMANIPIVPSDKTLGAYVPPTGDNAPQIHLGKDADKSTLTHELQHGIQGIEDFARGGSPVRLAGEKARTLHEIDPALSWAWGEFNPMYRRLFPSVSEEDKKLGLDWAKDFGKEHVKKMVDDEIEKEYKKTGEFTYTRLTGEAEARLAQRRMDMTAAERRATPPWVTLEKMLREEGVLAEGQKPEDVLISRRDVGGVAEAPAWHGSPHVFAPEVGFPHGRFRLDKIGTGEGAQAYGWGIYFADKEAVGEQYKKTLSNKYPVSHSGVIEEGGKYLAWAKPIDGASVQIIHTANTKAEAKKFLKGYMADKQGSLYHLDIPDDVMPKLLDWDKTLSEQPESVKKILANSNAVKEIFAGMKSRSKVRLIPRSSSVASTIYTRPVDEVIKAQTGSDLYDRIGTSDEIYKWVESERKKGNFEPVEAGNSTKRTSLYLNSLGIPGVKHLDGDSRGAGEGSHNYVIWDQPTLDRITLLKRNEKALDDIRGEDMRFSLPDDIELPKASRKYYEEKRKRKAELNPVWDYILEQGGLDLSKVSKAEKAGVPRALVAPKGHGQAPDVMLAMMTEDMRASLFDTPLFDDEHAYDLLDKLKNMKSPEQLFREEAKKNREFENAMKDDLEYHIQRQAPGKKLIYPQQLMDGDVFMVNGVVFTAMADPDYDGRMELVPSVDDGGEVSTIGINDDLALLPSGGVATTLYADKGSFQRAGITEEKLEEEIQKAYRKGQEDVKKKAEKRKVKTKESLSEIESLRAELTKLKAEHNELLDKGAPKATDRTFIDKRTGEERSVEAANVRKREQKKQLLEKDILRLTAKLDSLALGAQTKTKFIDPRADIESARKMASKIKITPVSNFVPKIETESSKNIKDPVLRGVIEEAEDRQTRMIAREERKRETSDRAGGILKKMLDALNGQDKQGRIKVSYLLDIATAMHDLQMKTGLPFYDLQQELAMQAGRNAFDDRMEVRGVVEGTKFKTVESFINSKSEGRVTYFIGTGEQPPSGELNADEMKIATNIIGVFEKWEPLVKKIRFVRWLNTGELPISENATQTQRNRVELLLQRGAHVLSEKGEAEFEKWLNQAEFGVRTHYLPFIHKFVKGVKTLRTGRFGRGFTQTREALKNLPEGWEDEYPLIGSLSRYIKNTRSIESLEPTVIKLQELFEQASGAGKVDPGVVRRYFDNILGVREPTDGAQNLMGTLTGAFFRARIPQQIATWISRNSLQNVVLGTPKVFTPTSPDFWKGLYEAFRSMPNLAENRMMQRFKSDPELAQWFSAHVANLSSVMQEYRYNEMSKWEAVGGKSGLKTTMDVLDTIGGLYSDSDTVNRMFSFSYAYAAGKSALERYKRKPTEKNWANFVDVTGLSSAGHLVESRVAALVDSGDFELAARLAAKNLTDYVHWLYNRKDKPLGWQQRGAGLDMIAPIATFSRSVMQEYHRVGIMPMIDFVAEAKAGKVRPGTRRRAWKALKYMGLIYAASLAANKIWDWWWDNKYQPYSVTGMVSYIPGGPALNNAINFFKGIAEILGDDDNTLGRKIGKVTTDVGDEILQLYFPGYFMGSRVAGAATGIERLRPMRELADLASPEPKDTRRYTDRNLFQIFQYIFGRGSSPATEKEVVKKYGEKLDIPQWGELTEDQQRQLEIVNSQLEALLRKTPVRAPQKDVARVAENVEKVVPSIARNKRSAVRNYQLWQKTSDPEKKEEYRRRGERAIERLPIGEKKKKLELIIENTEALVNNFNEVSRELELERKR